MRAFLRSVLLCAMFLSAAGTSKAEEPAAIPPARIELTQVDDQAIAYATFQSHNQKVVCNRHGIFITYVRSAAEDYFAQTWRLAQSTDEGRTFETLFEETRA